MRRIPTAFAAFIMIAPAASALAQQSTGESEPKPAILEQFETEASNLRALFDAPIVLQFLNAVGELPAPPPRVIHHDAESGRYVADDVIADAPRENLRRIELDPDRYYLTKYGTPLAYARVLQACGELGFDDLEQLRILDFGYGTVGHLRLMAMNGTQTVGIDVDSLLSAMYADAEDAGTVVRRRGRDGHITLVEGFWPGDDSTRVAAGTGFDIITSKNTLKKGYINPERQPDPDVQIELGVPDNEFLAAVYNALNPGGAFIIYNICPALKPAPEPYVPWADGRSPFTRAQFESAGFTVHTFNKNDDIMTRAMARALAWDQGEQPMDIEQDLTGTLIVVQKPKAGAAASPTGEAPPRRDN